MKFALAYRNRVMFLASNVQQQVTSRMYNNIYTQDLKGGISFHDHMHNNKKINKNIKLLYRRAGCEREKTTSSEIPHCYYSHNSCMAQSRQEMVLKD